MICWADKGEMHSSTWKVRRKWYSQKRIQERGNHQLTLDGEAVFSLQVDRERVMASGRTRSAEEEARVKALGLKTQGELQTGWCDWGLGYDIEREREGIYRNCKEA